MSRDLGTVRISEQGKDQLIRLKRLTGIQGWNVLCRWALVASVSEKSAVGANPLGEMSNIEMSWRTFAGPFGPLIQLMVLQSIGSEPSAIGNLDSWVSRHIHRGLGILTSSVRSREGILDLTSLQREH